MVEVDVYLDGQQVESVRLPTRFKERRFIPFWRYELPDGPHTVRLVVQNPSPTAYVWLERAILYGSRPVAPTH